MQAINGSGATTTVVHENASNITTQLGNTFGFVNAVQPNGSNPSGNAPQAFLTILFFDERFNFIPSADGGVAQQQVAATVDGNGAALALSNIKAPKNGYAYVYLSNQSNNDVYFDDFQVGVTAGNIIEENHYYAYWLKIATISSRKMGNSNEGSLKNNYLYNDKEFFEDGDLNWYDYGFRNYDPQIGRFVQLDPLTNRYPFYTPYQFAGCEPIANIDVDGLEPANVTKFMTKLQDAGASGVKWNVIASGRNANHFRVLWFKDGIAFQHVFKATSTATGPVGSIVRRVSSYAVFQMTTKNCHGPNLPGWSIGAGRGPRSSWFRPGWMETGIVKEEDGFLAGRGKNILMGRMYTLKILNLQIIKKGQMN